MSGPLSRILGALLALVAAAGLGLQLAMFVGLMGGPLGIWRWLGFFTVWSNLLAVVVGAMVAAGGPRSPRLELILLVALAGVGLVYSLLLRATWDEQGVQRIAGIILHDATPLIAAALWLTLPHGRLGARDGMAALAFPALFLLIAELRGQIEGWVPYGFLDPQASGLALNLAVTMAVFGLIAAALVAIDQRLARYAPSAAAVT